jgi:hypothetical protein
LRTSPYTSANSAPHKSAIARLCDHG